MIGNQVGTERLMLRCRMRCALLAFIIAAAGIEGCQTPIRTIDTSHRDDVIIMLPGVEGGAWQFVETVKGLKDAGVSARIEILEWGVRPLGSLANLGDLAANQNRAERIAQQIVKLKETHAARRITLLGYSGGGGLAVLTAERLERGGILDRLVLVGAAISPRHDLSATMRVCANGIVNFYSKLDNVTLGLGTRVFGTIDRVNSDSAGHVGFQDERGALLKIPGLSQREWRNEWAALGHHGMHTGWLARGWAREVLAKAVGRRNDHLSDEAVRLSLDCLE